MSDFEITRKPTTAKAWQFKQQPYGQWPEWVRKYEVITPMGKMNPGNGLGVLLLPTINSTTINVLDGEWLVLENERIAIYTDTGVRAAFDVPGTAETPAVTTAPPAETPAAPPAETPGTAETAVKPAKK